MLFRSHLQAEDAVSLQAMQQALAAHLLEFGQIDGAALRWDGDGAAATASPFRWMQVVEVEAVTPWLRRVQLRGQDLARFAQDAHLHCKLYFPAPGQVLESPLVMAAEDFSYYQREVPGLFVFLGINKAGVKPEDAATNHSPNFFVNEEALATGVRALGLLAVDWLAGDAAPTTQ